MAPTSNKDKRFVRILNHHLRLIQTASIAAVSVVRLQQLLALNLSYVDKPLAESMEDKDSMQSELLKKMTNSDQFCHNILRMSKDAFFHLCEMLRGQNLVKDTKNSSVEEKVVQFLYLVTHNMNNREYCFFFHRPARSSICHFHEMLRAIISLHDQFIKQPDGTMDPPQIRNTNRFYPYFKDCLGAIDGTHVRVQVPSEDVPKYKWRKDWPTTNILAACTFDMKFTYVLAGWEGSASDSRILKDALTRTDNLKIPEGKYYLGDAGYRIKSFLLTPYRGVRYHLKEYSSRAPENVNELFNLRHASARNVIERAFGVLKKRFPIITCDTEPCYPIKTHIQIILACCILHNYLMGVDPDANIIAEVDEELTNMRSQDALGSKRLDEDAKKGVELRDSIAFAMWSDYVPRK